MITFGKSALCAVVMSLALLAGGCKTEMPKPSGFLSDYSHLTEADDSTWKYVDAAGLAGCDKFIVAPVTIMATNYLGTTFSEAQKQKLAEAFRERIIKAVSARYPITTNASPQTGEIRFAFTRVYRVGNALAMGAEAEVVNSESRKQLAALDGVKLGPPEMGVNTDPANVKDPSDPSHYVEAWWNKPAAEELINRWAGNVARLIEGAGKK